MLIIQIIIFVTSASAIWLVSSKKHWRRWGYIIGLVGQPFWLYSTFVEKQWGIFLLALFYMYSWGQGVWNYWIKDRKIVKCKICGNEVNIPGTTICDVCFENEREDELY